MVELIRIFGRRYHLFVWFVKQRHYSPPRRGGEDARTKSEQTGWSDRRGRFAELTTNLGFALFLEAARYRACASRRLRAIALALRGGCALSRLRFARARASRPARQLLLSCRATPPLRGGEYADQIPYNPRSVCRSSAIFF